MPVINLVTRKLTGDSNIPTKTEERKAYMLIWPKRSHTNKSFFKGEFWGKKNKAVRLSLPL